MPLHRCRLLSLANDRRLLVVLASTDLREYARFLASALETPQGNVKWFILPNTNGRHQDSLAGRAGRFLRAAPTPNCTLSGAASPRQQNAKDPCATLQPAAASPNSIQVNRSAHPKEPIGLLGSGFLVATVLVEIGQVAFVGIAVHAIVFGHHVF